VEWFGTAEDRPIFGGEIPSRSFEDENGAFELRDLNAARLGLRFEAVGFAPQKIEAELKPGSASRDLEVRLRRESRRRGRVLEKLSGRPVPGATVRWLAEKEAPLGRDATGRATTGPDGVFALQGVEPGRGFLVATHEEFLTARSDLLEAGEGEGI